MSIGAIIQDPKDEAAARFYVPVATEEFFRRVWTPACEELDLKRVGGFSGGVVLGRGDWDDVRRELVCVDEWAAHNLPEADAAHVRSRVRLLLEKLEVALLKDDLKVFIG